MYEGRALNWIWDETTDFWNLLYLFFNGYRDNGDSWERAYAILKHNGYEKWVSRKTISMFPRFEYYMLKGDYMGWVREYIAYL